ncbi:MAG TPA: hypothetical protein VG275_00345 [Solirubrobacteraceae bacterium]|jgi:hypothetical protein|nr:hypothetical protein [Solirubrobacteraceae bacterium]
MTSLPRQSYSEPGDRQTVYACMSVESLPTPHVASEEGRCDGCGRATWFDPESYELARRMAMREFGLPDVFVQCDQCAERWVRSLAAARGIEIP